MLTPSPEQVADATRMREAQRLCVYSEAGTGKTLTAIHAALPLLDHGVRALVVAPRIALSQWEEELRAHDVPVCTLRTGRAFKTLPARGAVVTSWALAAAARDLLREWRPAIAVLDEAHALARTTAQRSKVMFGRQFDLVGGLLQDVPYIWPMTGTPILAYPDDLWPTLHALFPGRLRAEGVKRLFHFRQRHCVMEKQRVAGGRLVEVIVGGQREGALNDMLYGGPAPLAIRRRLVDVDASLPARRERRVELSDDLPLPPMPEPSSYEEAEALLTDARYSSARALFGLAKAADGLARLRDATEPTLALFWHAGVAEIIAGATGDDVAVIDGATPGPERERLIARFRAGDLRVLLGQIGTMGTALNLQSACRRVLFVERIGSPALTEQAIRRVWRRGQTQSVTIEHLVADHPLERATDMALARKGRTQSLILDQETL